MIQVLKKTSELVMYSFSENLSLLQCGDQADQLNSTWGLTRLLYDAMRIDLYLLHTVLCILNPRILIAHLYAVGGIQVISDHSTEITFGL